MSSLQSSSASPPATVLGATVAASDSDGGVIPAADTGLMAPQITELLPNPTGTGNDDTDEFIELYNPNDAAFDLTGFVLQTGITTKHSYAFPAGTTLKPKGFVAFYSADSGLSLSNGSGMADLLDPLGNQIGQTDQYGTAKDGQSWALAKGTWAWSLLPTPNAANIIKPPATTPAKSKATKGAGTTKGKSASAKASASPSSDLSNTALQVTPVHGWVLAVIAALAVGYGVYEYRLDLANRLYRLRRHREDRQRHRPPAAGRRSPGAS